MKKIYFWFLLLLLACATETKAQYHITSHHWYHDTSGGYYNDATLLSWYDLPSPDTAIYVCNNPVLYVTTNAFDSALSIKTYFGDGTFSIEPVLDSGSYGCAYGNSLFYHLYFFPGIYTIKQVLLYGGTQVDSITGIFEHHNCNSIGNVAYYDSSGAGYFVPGVDRLVNANMKFAVDSNGAVLDTFNSLGQFYYTWRGDSGTVYSIKPLVSSSMIITEPIGSVLRDTVPAENYKYFTNYFGLRCSGVTAYDLALNASSRAGRHYSGTTIIVDNTSSCNGQDATLTAHFSPKYNFSSATPAPLSVVGNTVVWSLPGISLFNQQTVSLSLETITLPYLTVGDTVNYNFSVTPTAGDGDPSNNNIVIVDTVTGSYDPNEMTVNPSGNISSGTKLQYTIGFENTGNDTAFNITVYDTLPNFVDVKSLNVVASSAVMNVATINHAGNNIVRFNFPHINLLDSSHHGQCDGMLTFTINTLAGLPMGTTIFNHAGIVFDDNAAVLTDTVEDIIGIPEGVAGVNNNSKITVYPNPANDMVTINVSSGRYETATFTNVLGQVVASAAINAAQTQVNVSRLPAGMYYITVRGASGARVVKFEKM